MITPLVDRHHELQRAARGECLRCGLPGQRGLIRERPGLGRSRRAAGERRRETDGCRCQQRHAAARAAGAGCAHAALGGSRAGARAGVGLGQSRPSVEGTACASWCRGNSRRTHCPISKYTGATSARPHRRGGGGVLLVPRWIQLVALPARCSSAGSSQGAVRHALFVFLISGIIAMLLNPLVSTLASLHFPRGLAVLVVYLSLAASDRRRAWARRRRRRQPGASARATRSRRSSRSSRASGSPRPSAASTASRMARRARPGPGARQGHRQPARREHPEAGRRRLRQARRRHRPAGREPRWSRASSSCC